MAHSAIGLMGRLRAVAPVAWDQCNVSLTIDDNQFIRRWGVARIQAEVAPDGSISGAASTSDSHRMRTMAIDGKIDGDAVEATMGTALRAVHLSLKRS
jgi:hypothetical protein